MNKLLKIVIWVVAWVGFSFFFVNYLPQHADNPMSVLISPLVLPMMLSYLVFDPSELAVSPFSLDILFGGVFWIVFFVLLYFPRAQKKS